eukprot:1183767-Prorocentrum_minimum.AAC.3
MARKPKSSCSAMETNGGEIASVSDRCGVDAQVEQIPEKPSSRTDPSDPTERLLQLWPDWDQPDGSDPNRPVRVFADGENHAQKLSALPFCRRDLSEGSMCMARDEI